ncbi:hypothetical protein SALBM135S_03440 [Streptomyces alboniger]
MSEVASFRPPASPLYSMLPVAEVTPCVISWAATSIEVRGFLLPSPSPYVMQKQLSSQKALTKLLPKCTRDVAPLPSPLMPLRPWTDL